MKRHPCTRSARYLRQHNPEREAQHWREAHERAHDERHSRYSADRETRETLRTILEYTE